MRQREYLGGLLVTRRQLRRNQRGAQTPRRTIGGNNGFAGIRIGAPVCRGFHLVNDLINGAITDLAPFQPGPAINMAEISW